MDRPSMLTRAKTALLEGERQRPYQGSSSVMRSSQLNNIPEESRKSEE